MQHVNNRSSGEDDFLRLFSHQCHKYTQIFSRCWKNGTEVLPRRPKHPPTTQLGTNTVQFFASNAASAITQINRLPILNGTLGILKKIIMKEYIPWRFINCSYYYTRLSYSEKIDNIKCSTLLFQEVFEHHHSTTQGMTVLSITSLSDSGTLQFCFPLVIKWLVVSTWLE